MQNNQKPGRTGWDIAKGIGDGGEHRILQALQAVGLPARIVNQKGHDITLAGSIEVKTDARAEQTGHAAIEIEYKGRPSGIMATTAHVWVHVVGNVCYIIATQRLREIVNGRPSVASGEHARIVLLPLTELARASFVAPLPHKSR